MLRGVHVGAELRTGRAGLSPCRGRAEASLCRSRRRARPDAARARPQGGRPMMPVLRSLGSASACVLLVAAPAAAQGVLRRQERDTLRRQAAGRQGRGPLSHVEGERRVPAQGAGEIEGRDRDRARRASTSRARTRKRRSRTGCGSTPPGFRSRASRRRRSRTWVRQVRGRRSAFAEGRHPPDHGADHRQEGRRRATASPRARSP